MATCVGAGPLRYLRQPVLEERAVLHDDIDIFPTSGKDGWIDCRITLDDQQIGVSAGSDHADLPFHHHLGIDARRRDQGIHGVLRLGAQSELFALILRGSPSMIVP